MITNLIYNPNAGSTNLISAEELCDLLREAGFEPAYKVTERQEDLEQVMQRPRGLYVVAGGDGSVRAAAKFLMGRKAPLTILPLGTANNIAASLGIRGPVSEILAGLKNHQSFLFDVGLIRMGEIRDYFLEVFGIGLFAESLAKYQPEKGKSLLRSLITALQTISTHESQSYKIKLDGKDVSGKCLMVEVMNTPSFGIGIKAAPQADPGDGLLDVVCVQEENRESLLTYALAMMEERLEELPSINVLRGRRLEISWNGFYMHTDAEVYPKDLESAINSDREKKIRIDLRPKALEFWIPQPDQNQAPS